MIKETGSTCFQFNNYYNNNYMINKKNFKLNLTRNSKAYYSTVINVTITTCVNE